MTLTLRPPRPADEGRLRELHAQMVSEGFTFLHHDGPWDEVLDQHRREAVGTDLAPGRVRCDFLVATLVGEDGIEGPVVGRTSIRHELTSALLEDGGHVGYAVAAEHRRRGYATEILRQSVAILAAEGVPRVLVTCDDGNIGSARVIEACGGVLEDVRSSAPGASTRRYWIPT